MMTISKDLLLAILSLDAYNRGYGAGIGGLSDAKGTKIGAASVDRASSSDPTSDEFSAGFYAIAYTDPTHGTVISYRGTDFDPGSDLADDIIHGWAFGIGDYRAYQLNLSTDFLAEVAASSSNITLTGHSLGGGLASLN